MTVENKREITDELPLRPSPLPPHFGDKSQILECQELESKIAALESIIESIRNEKAILASKVSNLEERLQDIETIAVCLGKDHVALSH